MSVPATGKLYRPSLSRWILFFVLMLPTFPSGKLHPKNSTAGLPTAHLYLQANKWINTNLVTAGASKPYGSIEYDIPRGNQEHKRVHTKQGPKREINPFWISARLNPGVRERFESPRNCPGAKMPKKDASPVDYQPTEQNIWNGRYIMNDLHAAIPRKRLVSPPQLDCICHAFDSGRNSLLYH